MPSDELTTELEAAVKKVEVEGITSDPEPTPDPASEPDPEPTGDPDPEPTPGPAPEPDPELTPELDPEPTLSNELLERAVSVGIPVADARELGPESLGRIIEVREAARERDYLYEVPKEEPEGEPADPFADIPKLDPDVHDPATIAMFEKLTGIAKQQQETIRGFETRQGDAEYATQEANRRDTTQWFDKQVESLGEDFADALGAGGYDALDQGSMQFAKREELANQVSVLLAGYEAVGQQAPPREKVFEVAARLVLRDEYQQIHDKGLSKDLESRAGQHIQRASGQRATGKESPMEEAARMLDEKYPS